MTAYEFSNQFDILYNNIMSDSAPGLSEYEKSVFLTQAQDAFIDGVYNSQFERTEDARRMLDALVTTAECKIKKEEIERIIPSRVDGFYHEKFQTMDNMRNIIFEQARLSDLNACNDGDYVQVIPERWDDLHRDLKNPFRGPSNSRVLRLDDHNVELVSKYRISAYRYTYIRKAYPIILEELNNGLTIHERQKPLFHTRVKEGEQVPEDGEVCELREPTHDKILAIAVELAKKSYQ